MIIKENTIDNGCVNVTIKSVRTSLTEDALTVFKTIANESKYLQIKTADIVDMQNYDMVKDNCISKPSFICTNDVNHIGVSLEGDHMIRNWDLFGSMINCSSTKAYEIYAPIYSSYIRTLLYSLTLDVDYSSKLKAVRDGVTKQINTEV